MRELAIDGNLKSVIVGAQPTLEEKRLRSTAKGRYKAGLRRKIRRLAVQGLPQITRARQGGIDVQVRELVNCLRANVSYGDEEVSRKLALYYEVPGFDVTPLQFARTYGAFQSLGGQLNSAAADVRTAYGPNPDWNCSAGKR